MEDYPGFSGQNQRNQIMSFAPWKNNRTCDESVRGMSLLYAGRYSSGDFTFADGGS